MGRRDISAFTVNQICPAELDPAFAGPKFEAQFHAVAAADVVQMKTFAGQLKSGMGDDFVRGFLSELSTAAAPNRTVASESKEVGGRQVTYFTIPMAAEGCAYATGPTVVMAFDVAEASEGATAEEAFTKILDRLH